MAAAASSSAYQRERGRPASGRDDAGGAHHPGALDRRARAGDRHVDRDQREDATAAERAAGCPSDGQQRRRASRRQQDHVLAADGEQVSQARALEVLDRGRVDAVVLAEHEAAERAPPRRPACPRPSADLGAVADRVERARRGRRAGRRWARSARLAGPSRSRGGAGSPASQSAGAPSGPARPHLAADREVGHRLRGLDQQPPGGGLDRAPGPCPSLRRGTAATKPRDGRLGARPSAEGPGVDRAQPRGRRPEPGKRRAAAATSAARRPPRGPGPAHSERAPGQRPPSARRARSRAGRGASGESASPAPPPAERREPPRSRPARRTQGWRRPRSASIVAGPMPLIWSSSSTEERPPCWSRKSMMSARSPGRSPRSCRAARAVAVPRLIGPSAPRRRRRRRRDPAGPALGEGLPAGRRRAARRG